MTEQGKDTDADGDGSAAGNTGENGGRGLSRRKILGSVGAGSIAALAGCQGGDSGEGGNETDIILSPDDAASTDSDGGDSTSDDAGGDSPIVDPVYNAFYTLNPPNDLYFNPFGTVAAGMGLYHWAMMFTGVALYDALNPERAMSAIFADHPRDSDPIEDGTATINIREDLTWHNGDAYTARDFATGRLMQLYIAESTGGEAAIPYTDVRVVDDYTLEVDMRDPTMPHDPWWDIMYGANLHHSCCTISNGPIWVKHSQWSDWLQRFQDAGGQDEMQTITQELRNVRRPFEETIGYGPWKISGISGQTVEYEPHEDWPGLIAINWPDVETGTRVGRDVQETWLDNDMTAELTFYAERSVQGQAAMGGELDFARLDSESQGQSLVDQGWAKPPRTGRVYAANTTVGYHVNFGYEPLAKTNVRKALLHLMPQQKLATIGYQNTQETSQQSPVPIPAPTGMNWGSVMQWLDADAVANNWSSYTVDASDTEQATALLEEAGLSNEGGTWYTESGDPFELDMVQSSENPVQVSRAFKGVLDEFGISTNFTAIEGTLVNDRLASGNFDLFYDFDEGGMRWPGTMFQQAFTYLDQSYPWGSSSSKQVNHPDTWQVPSTIGDPSSSTEEVDVVPMIQSLNQQGNDFESLTRQLSWAFNQTVPSLIYANGEYKPTDEDRRPVGQMYNANDWYAIARDESYGMNIMGATGNPGYPQSRHHFGAFKPRQE